MSQLRPDRCGPHPFSSAGPQFERDCTECDRAPEHPIHQPDARTAVARYGDDQHPMKE